MPDYLFQPYASATTAIIYLRKGIPHPKKKRVFFARVNNDGFRLKKGVRITCAGDELPNALDHFQGAKTEEGFSGWASLDNEFSFAPGAYIPAREMAEAEVDHGVREVIRGRTAFTALHASELVALHTENAIDITKARKAFALANVREATVGDYFEIRYGQKALHSKEGLLAGKSLVISSSGVDNGCYGFFDFEGIMQPPFVTVPSTGSIAIAHVQEWPCGVTDDCLLLSPKAGVPHAMLYIAAAAIRNERWRFSYGRKATPARIADFPLPHTEEFLQRVTDYLERATRVEDQILADAEDALDSQIARERLAEIDSGKAKLVTGAVLDARLAALMDD